MKELAAAWAIIYLVSGADASRVGSRIAASQDISADVTGLLVPAGGVVQLEGGTRLRPEAERGSFLLHEGRVRLVARGVLALRAGDWRVTVNSSEAVVSHPASGEVEVCATGSGVTVSSDARPRGAPASSDGGDAVSDSAGRTVPSGICLRLGIDDTELERPFAPEASSSFDALVRSVAPPPAELPDVVGDLSAQLDEVESQWSERLDSGPQREAQSCGCS